MVLPSARVCSSVPVTQPPSCRLCGCCHFGSHCIALVCLRPLQQHLASLANSCLPCHFCGYCTLLAGPLPLFLWALLSFLLPSWLRLRWRTRLNLPAYIPNHR